MDKGDSDQDVRMPWLICDFAERTNQIVVTWTHLVSCFLVQSVTSQNQICDLLCFNLIEHAHDKTNNLTCNPRKLISCSMMLGIRSSIGRHTHSGALYYYPPSQVSFPCVLNR